MRKINASRNSTYIKFDPFVSRSLLRVSEKLLSLSILDFPFRSPTCAEKNEAALEIMYFQFAVTGAIINKIISFIAELRCIFKLWRSG